MEPVAAPAAATLAPIPGAAEETGERPLAYVETIRELRPIPGADVIEVAVVRGWNVVVKKGLYKPGDLVVYCEIDSILPPWQFFINDKLDKAKFRIRTIKLRNQLSQGYCIPVPGLLQHPNKKVSISMVNSVAKTGTEVPALVVGAEKPLALELGTDLTQWIGIKKYEEADTGVNIGGKMAGNWPAFLRKTDQARIQNKPEFFGALMNVDFEVSEKLEGSSITAFFHNGDCGICSRNYRLKELDNNESVAVKTLAELKILELLAKHAKNFALQGELLGPGIQGNIYKLTAHTWRIFDVYVIDEGRHATPQERTALLKHLGIENLSAPILFSRKLEGLTMDTILAMSDGDSILRKGQLREGLVWKAHSIDKGQVVSFKTISNQYLLKKKDHE